METKWSVIVYKSCLWYLKINLQFDDSTLVMLRRSKDAYKKYKFLNQKDYVAYEPSVSGRALTILMLGRDYNSNWSGH